MDFEYKTHLPEDFSILCDIFQISPKVVIDEIISRISFPLFYSKTYGKERWPTLLFIQVLEDSDDKYLDEMEFNEPYLEEMHNAVEHILLNVDEKEPVEDKEAELQVRKIMQRWHRDLMKERARYLLDNLPEDDKQ